MKRATLRLPLAVLVVCALAGAAHANEMYVGETAIGTMSGPGAAHDVHVDLIEGDEVLLKLTIRGSGGLTPVAVMEA